MNRLFLIVFFVLSATARMPNRKHDKAQWEYLQWGCPGTEFSGYADGVAVGRRPLGPFTHVSLPLSYKPGGFICGASHFMPCFVKH